MAAVLWIGGYAYLPVPTSQQQRVIAKDIDALEIEQLEQQLGENGSVVIRGKVNSDA